MRDLDSKKQGGQWLENVTQSCLLASVPVCMGSGRLGTPVRIYCFPKCFLGGACSTMPLAGLHHQPHFLFKKICLFIFYVFEYFTYLYVCGQGSQSQEKGIRSSRIRAADGCEPPCACWELNQLLCKSNRFS